MKLPSHLHYKDRSVRLKYHRFQTGNGHHPPNALSALAEVLEGGAQAIEFDVGLTLDGVYVLIHDTHLERETTGVGPVRLATHTEIKRLHLRGSAERVATLSEVVGVLSEFDGPLKVQVDLKETVPLGRDEAAWLHESLRPLLEKDNLEVVVGCLADWNLRMLARVAPELPLGFDIAFHLDAPVGEFLRLPIRVNAYGYLDDHPLGYRRVLPTPDYLADRIEAISGLVPRAVEFYLRKDFVLQALEDGYNPVEHLHRIRPGVTVDVWTLDADEPAAREKLLRLLRAGVDQITTNTPLKLAELFETTST